RKMLLTTKRRVTDIAGTVGFDNVGYFDRLFKKAYGVTPNQLRRHAIEQGLALLHHRAEKRTRGLG
ncbi:AraC family transcriptional regulator, partial [Paenibacillus riograndensis]